MPPGIATLNAEVTAKPARQSAGQDARLYGRRDARRCANYIRTRRGHRSAMSNQDGLCFIRLTLPVFLSDLSLQNPAKEVPVAMRFIFGAMA